MGTQVANQPELVTECANCEKEVNLRRHIKKLKHGKYYAICYDCDD